MLAGSFWARGTETLVDVAMHLHQKPADLGALMFTDCANVCQFEQFDVRVRECVDYAAARCTDTASQTLSQCQKQVGVS